jgi:hypothetical protein
MTLTLLQAHNPKIASLNLPPQPILFLMIFPSSFATMRSRTKSSSSSSSVAIAREDKAVPGTVAFGRIDQTRRLTGLSSALNRCEIGRNLSG